MISKKMLALAAVMLLFVSFVGSSVMGSDAAEAGTLERHYTTMGEFNNNSEPFASQSIYQYFGTALNPYSSVNVDVVKIPSTQRYQVYVLEGAPCKVYTMEQIDDKLHNDLISHGFSFENGWYVGKAYYKFQYPGVSFALDHKFCIFTVKQEGYLGYEIGDSVSSKNCSTESEPILFLDSESIRWFGDLPNEIYLAEGAHFRLKTSDGKFFARLDGKSLGISEVDGYLFSDFLQVGDTGIYSNARSDGNTEYTTILHVVPYNELPTVFFNANGGNCSLEHYTASSGTKILLPSAEGSDKFAGWFTEPEGGMRVGDAGDTYVIEKKTTLYAHYGEEKVSIVSKITDMECVLGSTFSYEVVTSPSKVLIEVEGPSWIAVSDHTVYGTPVDVKPGVYHVVIKATNGLIYDIQEFDLTVVEPEVKNPPFGKIIVHPVYEVIL